MTSSVAGPTTALLRHAGSRSRPGAWRSSSIRSASGRRASHSNGNRWHSSSGWWPRARPSSSTAACWRPRAPSWASSWSTGARCDRRPGLHFGRAREQAEAVRRSLADDVQNLITLASAHRGIGKALGKQGKPAAGLESLRRAVAIGDGIAAKDSLATYDLACTLALCGELGAALPSGTDDGGLESARRYAERAIAVLRQAIAAGWKDVDWMERSRPRVPLAARARRFPRGDPVPSPGERTRLEVSGPRTTAGTRGPNKGHLNSASCLRKSERPILTFAERKASTSR